MNTITFNIRYCIVQLALSNLKAFLNIVIIKSIYLVIILFITPIPLISTGFKTTETIVI
jgi:hypothetical protein